MKKLEKTDLRSVSGREGLSLDIDLDVTADFMEFSDENGHFVGGGTGNAGSLRLGNVEIGDGTTLENLTVDVADAGDLEIDLPDNAFPVKIDDVVVPADPEELPIRNGPVAGRLSLTQLDLGGAGVDLEGTNTGLSINWSSGIDIGAIHLEDEDGNSSNSRGLLILEEVGVDLPDWILDADENNGLMVEADGDNFSFDANTVCLETAQDFGSCAVVNNLISDLDLSSMDFRDSVFHLDGDDDGLTIDGEFAFDINNIELGDPDGTPENGSSGTVYFDELRFTDASSGLGESGGGNPVEIENAAEIHVDSTSSNSGGGLVVEAPSFSSSGSYDSPENELFVNVINVGSGCSSGCGSWMLRDFDPGGSWVKVSGR